MSLFDRQDGNDGSGPDETSPVLGRLASGPTQVARRDSPFGLIAGLAGVAALGLFVFTSLSHARQGAAMAQPVKPSYAAQMAAQTAALAAARAAGQAAAQSPATPAPVQPMVQTSASPSNGLPAVQDPSGRLHAPAMVVDIADPGATPAQALLPTSGGKPGSSADDKSASPEDRFAAKVAGMGVDTAQATRLRDTALVAPQGTVIPAILETAINSDLPGFVRAVVSRDVKGFDGSTVLIPRGSKLIGQYRSGVAVGQSRAFVVWSRVLTPEGVSVEIGSPAADRLGRGGLDGETNTHFFQRFGGSIMLSVLTAGLQAAAGNNGNTNTAIVIGSPQQATNIASIALQKQIDIPDTITVPQGTPIRVFVARDLDFSSVAKRAP
jgi:type IV secretion system protein VirB10